MPYVASLDGLRALAVFAVIFYHMGLSWMPGGLLGVTIFFVLSGYLITNLLLIEWDNTHTINLPQFWLRRIRRLFPAIVLVVLVIGILCIIFNHALFTKLREDMWAALCWIMNWWYILRDVSYFEALGAPSPLTHFWSLAIEEQFYVVWPVILLLAHRLGIKREWMRNATIVFAVLSVLEMAFMYSPDTDPSRVYYGTDTRAFSLLIGATLAYIWPAQRLREDSEVPFPMLPGRAGEIQKSFDSRFILEVLGIASMLGLIVMMVFCDGTSAFMYRGGLFFASLLTAIVIAAMVHPASALSRIMSAAPLVWIGIRSYGIYLWHYPILLLMSPYSTPSAAPWWLLIIELAIILALAALSYAFVEDPIRHKAIGNLIGTFRSGEDYLQAWVRRNIVPVAASAIALLIFIVGYFAVPYTSAIEGGDLLKDENAQVGGAELNLAETDNSEEATEQTSTEPATDENGMLLYDSSKLSVLWIGDSVSVRSLPYFEEAFPRGTIDARVNRWWTEGIEVYKTYSDQGIVGNTVVLALGTNGPITDEMVDEMMALIGTNRHVVLINNAMPDEWMYSNNIILQNAAARYSNISILDWASYSSSGIYFDGDGTHLTEEGAEVYVQLVADVINANGWLPAEASEPLPDTDSESEDSASAEIGNDDDSSETTEDTSSTDSNEDDNTEDSGELQ